MHVTVLFSPLSSLSCFLPVLAFHHLVTIRSLLSYVGCCLVIYFAGYGLSLPDYAFTHRTCNREGVTDFGWGPD